jgi:hypothetical protein
MKDFENILLSQMRDISGLQEASIWPLAIGWWIILFIFLLIIAFISFRAKQKINYRKSWKYKLELELNYIAKNTSEENAKENISKLNEILKRIALQTYERNLIASLSEKNWLLWLTDNDPSNFNWLKKGEILVNYPYMPKEKIKANLEDISTLAKAVKPWIKTV